MKITQFYLDCLAHASYLVSDERTGTAAVIDPQRDIEQYLEEARAQGVEIRYVLLTHFHADFLAGHLELREKTGAQICLGSKAEAEFETRNLADGDVLEFGDVRLKMLETPGHTPEGISIVAYDLATDPEKPEAVFTGDTLFIGDVGRPDLLVSIGFTAEELAGMLYDSLHEQLLSLPDETLVYPAHGAGSLCGKQLSEETVSTIGEQRKVNYALQPMTKEEFVRIVAAEQPEAPGYFVHDAILNRKERPTLDAALARELQPLTADDLLRLRSEGAKILDVRSETDYAAGHLVDSFNIGLDGKYATWAGTLLKSDDRLVVIAEPGSEKEAALRLGRIGFDNVIGYLDGGIPALEDRAELVRVTGELTPDALRARLLGDEPPLVVDIRSEKDWQAGHIEGSVNIPLTHLEERLDEVPTDRDVVLVCRTGYRSSMAVSLLERNGRNRQINLAGGLNAWQQDRLETSSVSS